MRPKSISIIGAGLGGLTAALALLRSGWKVTVYEQAPVLAEVGAGITIATGAGRALTALGIGPELIARSLPTPNVAFVHYATGALLAGVFDNGAPEDRGFDTPRHIHRADMHAALLEAVQSADPQAVRVGKQLVKVEANGGRALARFADGEVVETELLVAADGVRSVVRRQLFEDVPPEFAGQVAFRFLVSAERAAPFMGQGNAVVSVGAGRIFHRYAIRGGALVNVIGIAKSDRWREEGWNTPATIEEFLAEYEGFHSDVRGLIKLAPADTLIKWGLFVRLPIATWRNGAVVLLGDAAHPILPFLGLGAALAIEDGVVLARALESAPSVERALAAYQNARMERVEDVRIQTIRQGDIIQATDPDNYHLTRSPSQNVKLFDYDPREANLNV